MGKGSGTTRGDRRRNARRELLPRDGAVIGIDLAEDKQALAVADHDVRVLARKTVRVKPFRLGEALDWEVAQARVKRFAHVGSRGRGRRRLPARLRRPAGGSLTSDFPHPCRAPGPAMT